MSETSDSPSRNGLSHILTRHRDRNGRDSASNSVRSNGSEASHHGVRRTVETAIEKLKGHDDEIDTTGHKKMPGRGIGSRRRRKKQELAEEKLTNEAVERGRGVAERGTLENESTADELADSQSISSSMLTCDSDLTDP